MNDLDLFLKMPRKVQELFWKDIENIMDKEIDDLSLKEPKNPVLTRYDFCRLNACESPIEQILLAYFDNKFRTAEHFSDYGYYLHPQVNVNCDNKMYRVDFLAEYIEMVVEENVPPHETNNYLIVECDGHNFHEITKQQVKMRNQRDYDLKMLGFEVVHFSGSEIYNEPEKCIEKIKNLLDLKVGNNSNLLSNVDDFI